MKGRKILLIVLCLGTLAWLAWRISVEGPYRTPQNFFHQGDNE